MGAKLHIIDKPSFDISSKAAKRAGLDYWDDLQLDLHENWEEFFEKILQKDRIFLFTKFATTLYSSIQFQKGDYFVFGQETAGLPKFIHDSVLESQRLYLPMLPISRSINLSNSVAIAVYEGIRQIGLN